MRDTNHHSYFKNVFCFIILIILLSWLEKESVIKILTNSIPNIEFIPDWQTLVFSREIVHLLCKILFFIFIFEIISVIAEYISSYSLTITIICGILYFKFSNHIEILFNYCFNEASLLLEHFTFISHSNSLLIAQILFFIIIILFSNSNISFFSRIGRNSFFNFGLIILISIIENNFL